MIWLFLILLATFFIAAPWLVLRARQSRRYIEVEKFHSCDEIVQERESLADSSSTETRLFVSHKPHFGMLGPAKWMNDGL